MPVKGEDVYRDLMDLALALNDIGQMGPLRMFLGTIRPDHPSLIKLRTEVQTFKARLDGLVDASKGR